MSPQDDLLRPSLGSRAMSRITHSYGSLLKDPRWSIERKAKIQKLKAYAQSLRGCERELILKFYPDLLTK